jgi:hypothetical protein
VTVRQLAAEVDARLDAMRTSSPADGMPAIDAADQTHNSADTTKPEQAA